MIGIIILGVFAFMFLVSAGWSIGTYNSLITGKQNIATQWSNIKTEYKRRIDIFYNLVQSVKSYAKFEKGTLLTVTKARSGDFGKTKQETKKMMDKLSSMFSKLAIVFERYPNLKAVQQYNTLQREIRITEDRINVARTDYNDIIREYNLIVKTFPSSIIANMFKFQTEKYLMTQTKIDEEAHKIKLE